MPDRDLKLNSLSRYSKKSPRLVLEVHSHCEVPAGCGGVVLRWRNPDTSIRCEVHFLGIGERDRNDLTIDGKPPSGLMNVDLTYGEHVVAVKLRKINHQQGLLMFGLTLDKAYVGVVKLKGGDDVLSAADGTWKYTAARPQGDSWRNLGFDDSGWSTMIEKRIEREEGKQYSSVNYSLDRHAKLESIGLGIAENAREVWIRKVFRIEREDG